MSLQQELESLYAKFLASNRHHLDGLNVGEILGMFDRWLKSPKRDTPEAAYDRAMGVVK